MILVYHAKEMNPFPKAKEVIKEFDLGIVYDASDNNAYSHVASVNTDDMDQAYMLTNHIHENWCAELEDSLTGGFVKGDGKHRSTSVGDIFVCKDGIYLVDRIGFTLVRRFEV